VAEKDSVSNTSIINSDTVSGSNVNTMTFETFLTYKAHWDKKVEKEGKGLESFGKDKKLTVKSFGAAQDDCMDLLHPVR